MIHAVEQSTATATPNAFPDRSDELGSVRPRTNHTVWGLDAWQLHDRFWAARGIEIVRRGDASELIGDAELFLLTDPNTLAIFRLSQLIETLSWLKPRVLFARLHNTRNLGYQERVVTDDEDRFLRFERVYGGAPGQLVRVALTPDRNLAERWRHTHAATNAWRDLRHSIDPDRRTTSSVHGSVYNGDHDQETMAFLRELVSVWKQPSSTIGRARRCDELAWSDRQTHGQGTPRCIGPVWIGAGRKLERFESLVGPTIVWDDPSQRPEPDRLAWNAIEPTEVWAQTIHKPIRPKRRTSLQRGTKRVFDVLASIFILILTSPLFVLVPIAIWLEDRGKPMFKHRRESKGGQEFFCIKFRTMKRDSERIKIELEKQNQADGPQFFIEDDPRHTRVGKVMRKFNIDEFPQFWNVLKGEMSVVGPRPSPFKENQYCPPWREARLSVRPGVTGLWQVQRSREEGKDFQEWIRYDIEYVENLNWRMDLKIIFKTLGLMLPF